ncbi:hypothetical protein CI102_2519 [Trichoderma harzianum]|nr:hypothetical protein CI102_2519 [Trichoderma harzianum]
MMLFMQPGIEETSCIDQSLHQTMRGGEASWLADQFKLSATRVRSFHRLRGTLLLQTFNSCGCFPQPRKVAGRLRTLGHLFTLCTHGILVTSSGIIESLRI